MMVIYSPLLLAAQSAKLNISVKNGTLSQLFSVIEKQSGFLFFYVDADLPNVVIDISESGKTIDEILTASLKNTNLGYKIDGNNINIYKEVQQTSSTPKRRITGRVIDVKGETLPGVSVVELNTSNGTVTDIDGLYEISVQTKPATLRFTYLGYKPIDLQIGNQTVNDVVMAEDVNELDEFVVIGYGEQRRISNIGAQATLKTQDIKSPSGSLTTVLSGRLSGIVAVQRTGEPGKDAADIWIRGISTKNNSNPLILVDGVERSFNDIDPEDVESITTLKDASATAVYGVRGANGVIIVKTKPGIIGKPTVSIDYYEGVTRFTKAPKMADGLTFMNAANEAAYNSKKNPIYSLSTIQKTEDGSDRLLYPNVNWRKEIFDTWGHVRRANANVRGGSQNAQYYASVSLYNEQGLIKTNSYENYDSETKYTRYNFTTNLNLKVTETTSVDIGAQGYLGNGNYGAISSSDIYKATFEVSPVEYPKMFYIDGKEYIPGILASGNKANPYAQATKRGYKKEMTNKIYSNLRITQDLKMLLDGLKITAMYAYDVTTTRSEEYSKREPTYYFLDAKNSPYDENGNPILTQTFFEGSSTLLKFKGGHGGERKEYFESAITYDKTFNADHRVGGMFIYTQQSRTDNAPSGEKDAINAIPYRMQGIAGRASYSWKDRYFVEFNAGYNGAENFPPGKRFGFFPAMGVGWAVSNESFWQPLNELIPFLKIRYTNGKVGNSVTGGRRFMYIDQLAYDDGDKYEYGFGSGDRIAGIYTINDATRLGWEVAHKQDIGLDLKMFNSDLSLTFDLFKENRKNILMERTFSVPYFLGYTSIPFGNVGEIKNKGFDASIEYNKRLDKDWFLGLRGNITYNEDEWIQDDVPEQKYPWMNRTGFSILSIKGYHATGLYTQEEIDAMNTWLSSSDPNQGDAPYAKPPQGNYTSVKAGDIKFEDKNKDGLINEYDQTYIGRGDVPQITYGFGFNVQYKSFSVAALFQGTAKADRLINGQSIYPFNGDGGGGNVYSNISNRWNEENPNQDVFYPRLAWGAADPSNQNNFVANSWWIKDMSFFRLKTMQLSYLFPKKWTDKLRLKNGSVYLMANNIFTLSKFKLWDPELNTNDGTKYPNITSYSIGINFSF